MICKLCLQEKPLLKKSHIAPNFLYKELRDEDNAFVEGSFNDLSSKDVYTGLFESNILCKECDNLILGRLEDYACKILYGGKIKGMKPRLVNEKNDSGVEFITCYDVDYKKFKLFLLSLIWRFSIAESKFYNFVDLGEHEEKIRRMIFEDNAGEASDYPCCIQSYRSHSDLPFQIISQPMRHRHNSAICYSVIMSGLLYTFYISKALTPDYVSRVSINKDNKLMMINMPKENAVNIIKKYMGLNKI